jgi:hypothetical protein
MTESRFLGIGKRTTRKEPGYVRTTPYDGGKYIDPNEFLNDPEIQRQFEQFEELDDANGSQQERPGG